MTDDIIRVIQAVVRDELKSFRTAELGVVTRVHAHSSASDMNNGECDVRLRDSGLELKRLPVCTPRLGAVALPNPGDLVLVHYLRGDVQTAVVHGRLYNDTFRPPEAQPRESVYVSPDEAESGIRRLYVELPNGNSLLIDDDKLKVEMGSTTLTLNHAGDVELEAAGAIAIQARGDASIRAQGNLELGSDGDVKIAGNNVEIQGTSASSLTGMSTEIKGTTVKISGKVDYSAA